MNDNREYPNGEPVGGNGRNSQSANGGSEQGSGEIHSDDRIYPPRGSSASEERMSGYASTGYGGVRSGPENRSQNGASEGERQDYGVDPFSAGQKHRSERPYGMNGTYEWNFADYDQQSSAPARDQVPRQKRGRFVAVLVG